LIGWMDAKVVNLTMGIDLETNLVDCLRRWENDFIRKKSFCFN